MNIIDINKAWLTVYDFLAPQPRHDCDGLTTEQIDSIISDPNYKEMTVEDCFEELKRQGVIPNDLEY